MTEDTMTYMLAGDIHPRVGPRHLANTAAFRIQGGRVLPDLEPVKLDPIQEVEEQPAVRRGRPRKTEADADQA